jgi:homopolymeric O-antigen transport system permease protein
VSRTSVFETVDAPVVVIEPSRGWISLRLGEFWEYRELLYFLVWRDVKVRYKQTLLGAAWAILQPLLTMVVFTIFFGRLAGIGSDGVPYPLFSYAALLPWTFFAQGLTQSSSSLVGSSNLIKKVYFPRLIIPTATVLAGVVDFLLAFVVLLGMMAWYGFWPKGAVFMFPLFLLLALTTSLGVGMWLSALNVQFRDVRYVVPFLVQIWLFVTPVIYPMSKVTAKMKELGIPTWLYGLNPMAGVVEGFRWALLGTHTHPGDVLVASISMSVVLLLTGALYFRRMERIFADVV